MQPKTAVSRSKGPLTLGSSLLYFAIPSALFGVITWIGVPALANAGMPLIWSFTSLVLLGFSGLGLAAWLGAWREQGAEPSITCRLWLRSVRLADIAIGVAVGAVGTGAYVALEATVPWVLRILPFGPPEWMDHFSGPGTFFDVPMAHHPWLALVFLAIYLWNVVGEELWWRGYILPRQVAGMGSRAWIANGVLWCGFHVFQPWDVLPLVPIALGLAFFAQRRQSAWIGIIAHAALNALAWIPLFMQLGL